jgi:copper chaperone CopZ
MKTIIILLSSLLFTFTAYATNCHKEGGHAHDEVTTNGLSSGEITNNIININVNGMVCDFCAQSIEKVFMKRIEVKGINVDLEDQKVVIYLEKETDIEDTTISTIFEDAGYTVETINRNS